MNKNLLTTAISIVLLIFTCGSAAAKSWRVNNDTSKGANFADINAAMASEEVTAGDILYLDPGCNLTTEQIVTKRVTIVGCGYYRASSPHAFAIIQGYLTFSDNSGGSKIEGMIMTNQIRVWTNDVTFERCRTTGDFFTSSGKRGVIRQCYIQGNIRNGNGTSDGWTIENNIILAGIWNHANAIIRNNYIYGTGYGTLRTLSNCTIVNNVIINGENKNNIFSGVTDCAENYNVISASSTTNETDVALDSNDAWLVFENHGNNDERYQLKEGSPAIGAGMGGADCGPTGGNYPYIPGGMPAYHPYYTSAVIAAKDDGTGVNVSLKIKMQNE